MNDADSPYRTSENDLPLPDDFIEFLALDLALSREHAQRELVKLLERYRPSEPLPLDAWRERKPQPLS